MKISVITPSVRPEGLEIVLNSLKKQDFPKEDFEWIVVVNEEAYQWLVEKEINSELPLNFLYIKERPKKEGDFYSLTKALNDGFENATGKLCIIYQDMIWITPDTLSRFWEHYQNNPKICVGAIGNQYDSSVIEFGKPQVVVWNDPRKTELYGSFYEINPIDLEVTLVSIPKQAWLDVGGFDEIYDQGAAVGEKEFAIRIDKAGYKPYLDQSIEYRAIKHGRLKGSEEWDKHYAIACALLQKHIHEINEGARLKLDFIKE